MSLIVWLPLLNDNFNNKGLINHSITLASENSWESTGKIGAGSLKLSKLQNIVPTNSSMSGIKQMSYAYWVKVNTAWATNWLDGIRWTETNGNETYTARQEFYTNCTLVGTWYKGGSISGKTFTPGVWTHLAATFNYSTGEAKFYINGILTGTTTNIDTTYYCQGDFYIGDNGVDINMNDVRIYNHCLSDVEIKEISQGLVLHYKLDDIINGIIQDSSGYGHNGTITNNITFTNNTPRFSAASYLSKAKINCATGFPSGENPIFTVSFWAKILSSATYVSYGDLIGMYDKDQGENTFRLELCGSPAGNNLMWFCGPSGQSGGSFNMNSSSSSGWFTKDKWHHISLVGDGANKKYYCYLDGNLCQTYNGSSNTWEPTGQWYLGDTIEATAYFSDLRIYCTALSAIDIKQLYEVGAKIDNKQNLHTYEFNENNSNIFSSIPWTNSYSIHSSTSSLFSNYNANGEPQFTANSTSAGTDYITIAPGTYRYDYTISVNTGNQFYIGFERYDENKTSRSNNACVYTYTTKPSSDVIKQRYTGIIDLSTDGINPIKYIALRILNGWSGTTSDVTGQAVIHNFSLRLVSSISSPKLGKTGKFIINELKENTKASFYQDGIVEANNLIEF